jgi:hypothetical protein
MHAMLATPCWMPPSTVLRVCLDEVAASRRQTLQELRALLAEIAAPSEEHGCEPAGLPAELDNVLNVWLACRTL